MKFFVEECKKTTSFQAFYAASCKYFIHHLHLLHRSLGDYSRNHCMGNYLCDDYPTLPLPLLKILFVTNFDFVFAQNPEILGKKLLTFSLILGFVPQCLIGMYQTAKGVLSTSAVVFLMGMKQTKEVAPLMRMYGYIWLFASLLMLITTLLFIPLYVKMNHQVMALAEKRMEEETVHFRFGKMLVYLLLSAL